MQHLRGGAPAAMQTGEPGCEIYGQALTSIWTGELSLLFKEERSQYKYMWKGSHSSRKGEPSLRHENGRASI